MLGLNLCRIQAYGCARHAKIKRVAFLNGQGKGQSPGAKTVMVFSRFCKHPKNSYLLLSRYFSWFLVINFFFFWLEQNNT